MTVRVYNQRIFINAFNKKKAINGNKIHRHKEPNNELDCKDCCFYLKPGLCQLFYLNGNYLTIEDSRNNELLCGLHGKHFVKQF